MQGLVLRRRYGVVRLVPSRNILLRILLGRDRRLALGPQIVFELMDAGEIVIVRIVDDGVVEAVLAHVGLELEALRAVGEAAELVVHQFIGGPGVEDPVILFRRIGIEGSLQPDLDVGHVQHVADHGRVPAEDRSPAGIVERADGYALVAVAEIPGVPGDDDRHAGGDGGVQLRGVLPLLLGRIMHVDVLVDILCQALQVGVIGFHKLGDGDAGPEIIGLQKLLLDLAC